jgi:photosystem II stability/assembly factor-like uncharacterized protein
MAICAAQPSAGVQLKSVSVSADGGQTWTVHNPCPGSISAQCMNTNQLNFGYLGQVDFTSATSAYVVGDRSPLLVTHDSGSSWQAEQEIGDVTGPPAQVIFFDTAHGIVLGRGNTAASNPIVIWHTNNSGASWTKQTPKVT